MKVIALMSQKGGAGKTTVAVHLAVAANQRGLKCGIFDTDPQGSAKVWGRARQDAAPTVVTTSVTKLAAAIDAASKAGFDVLIIDTAPNAGPDAVDVARLANVVVIPVRPSVFDLAAAQRTIELVVEAGVEAMVLLSACPARAPEVQMAREALSATGFPVAKTTIGDRRPFARAIQSGRSVAEFEPGGKAAREIADLLTEILK